LRADGSEANIEQPEPARPGAATARSIETGSDFCALTPGMKTSVTVLAAAGTVG